tara:strand:+ start:585 stop:1163 length:579 start_codon:yes stop_codon:yes gene_type:complete
MPKEPLTVKEQDILLSTAKKYGPYRYDAHGHETGLPVDPFQAIAFMLDTGVHPSVLAEEKYQLHTVKQGPHIRIRWFRPKKKQTDAFTQIRASKRIKDWVEEFVTQEKPRFRQFYNSMLRRISGEIKKPSRGLKQDNMSPLALRHTFAVNRLNAGISTVVVQQLMNCSRKTLDYYSKFTNELIDDALDKEDF